MSISQNFPNTRPSLNLNFARSKTLDPRITFTRTSTATYVDESGFIRDAVADEPRFDHDPVTGECLGLLVEEERSNLIQRSEEFDLWSIPDMTISTNSFVAPDGNLTADILTIGSGSAGVRPSISVSITEDITYTASIYLNTSQTCNFIRCRFSLDNGGSHSSFFTVSSKTWTLSSNRFTGGTYEVFPNGWLKISVQYTPQIGEGGIRGISFSGVTSANSSTPDTGNTLIYWGAQLEEGAFPTSYIPTSGSTATRNPDNVSMVGDNFSDWYNPSEGTVYAKYSMKGFGTNSTGFNRIFEILDSESLNRIAALLRVAPNEQIYESFSIGPNNTQQMNFAPYAINFNEFNEYVIGFGTESQRYAYNASGVLSGNTDTDIDMSIFYPNQLNIGFQSDNTSRYLNGYISQFTYYPVRLSNSQLQNLILR